jgi:hypothetical protein
MQSQFGDGRCRHCSSRSHRSCVPAGHSSVLRRRVHRTGKTDCLMGQNKRTTAAWTVACIAAVIRTNTDFRHPNSCAGVPHQHVRSSRRDFDPSSCFWGAYMRDLPIVVRRGRRAGNRVARSTGWRHFNPHRRAQRHR